MVCFHTKVAVGFRCLTPQRVLSGRTLRKVLLLLFQRLECDVLDIGHEMRTRQRMGAGAEALRLDIPIRDARLRCATREQAGKRT